MNDAQDYKFSIDETHVSWKFLQHLGKNSGIMLDVGAHTGGSCERFLETGWKVYAFEPDIRNREYLEKMGKRFDNLTIDSRAVSDETGRDVPFFSSDISTGISGLSPFHESHRQTDTVRTVTLADYCLEKSINQVDFLKIDTEGFNLFALKGFPWDKVQPEIVVCEFEDGKTVPLGYNFHDLALFLVAQGYQVLVSEWFPIVEYGKRHKWRKFSLYPCEMEDSEGWGNLIAFRGEIDWIALANSITTAMGEKTAALESTLAKIRALNSWRFLMFLRKTLRWVSGKV